MKAAWLRVARDEAATLPRSVSGRGSAAGAMASAAEQELRDRERDAFLGCLAIKRG
jgi:hypothetical protein